ncbi:HalOD1 output domain-containing protein [Halostella pelagica]|uniref:HalOD1 output domain-containing protein n=1 Tax=Halostella pelagica TaxID=2583824 RepID=UPI001080FC76|nr:HalOD1 output domain-containing protein [Halostella pelagica]
MNADQTTPVERVAETESATEAVVIATAEATDADPLELDPLFDAVDPDALNRLFESSDDGSDRPSGRIEFTYAGCDVSVYADRRVVVSPTPAPTASATQTATSD